ncbi:type 1 glutamine amidotransferase [Paenibacillus sp. OAS669]|uniref:type 1 glutamine amidotransferase n=1 Tax=Paenibacillus sp. OAS669 TaxID=2663821 RepID=UPI00178B928D|nr:type 1 glutamine amidotransferase [Paenibacillus sp. OAS669]MBE1446794.1 GMP synthase-like glutamine amidotransferase [Paenibacillus sp. OAS669]
MRMLLLKHFDFDDPSYFISWAGQHEAELTILFPPNGFHAPAMDSFDLMIILGGPMSAYQDNEYPWLQSEKAFIREAVESGRKVLGICLGAQMLAEVLGGRVYRSPHKEIGWHLVKRNGTQHPLLEGVPDDFYSFHWHGDCFDIPAGAVSLASSEACRHQAFTYGEHVLGLQFHLETTEGCMTTMLERWQHELVEAPWIQKAERILEQTERTQASKALLHQILNNY